MAFPESLMRLYAAVQRDQGPVPGLVRRGRLHDEPFIEDPDQRSRRESLKLLGAMAGAYGTPYLIQRAVAASIDFRTDFREPDPLRVWNFLPGGGLDIRPEGEAMAAHPKGSNLLTPSERLDDGEITIGVAAAGSSTFLLRAQDDRHGYRVTFRRTPGKVGIEVWRLRKGQPNYVTHFNLNDGRSNAFSEPWLRFKLDGRYFTASLLSQVPGFFGRFNPSAPASRVLHNWIDKHYARGAMGLCGPQHYALGTVRVFSVSVSSSPTQESNETQQEVKQG